jgi:pimeloyl-ACP methyl ester carboxylesterase
MADRELISWWRGHDLRLEFRPDELHRIRTADACQVALGRYLPRGPRRFAEPVILCHGLGANRFTWDFDERYSLARRLAERGFEAWILELRGRGASGPAAQITFDRQAEHDVSAALRTVLGATGAKEVTWVGHSKGGLVALAHLARNPAAPIRAIAALGTPLSFEVQRGLKPLAKWLRPAMQVPAVPIATLAKLSLIVPPPQWFMRYLIHPENLDPDVRRRALLNVGSDVSGRVGRQFLEWIHTGRWTSEDRVFDYGRALEATRVPALMIAGTHDLLAPPESVVWARGRYGGPLEVMPAGRAHGHREDYGHGDLVLGRHAPEELYPRVLEFLETRSTRN